MAILRGILKDSRDHFRHMEGRIKARLKALPKGSILRRKLGGRDYYYLKIRKGPRVLSKYLGKKKPVSLEKDIKERRLLLKQLREVRQNLHLLAKTNRSRCG